MELYTIPSGSLGGKLFYLQVTFNSSSLSYLCAAVVLFDLYSSLHKMAGPQQNKSTSKGYPLFAGLKICFGEGKITCFLL